MNKDASRQLSGRGLSPGVAVGTAYTVERPTVAFHRTRIASREVSKELKRFHSAIERSYRQLRRVKRKFENELGKEHSYIIDAHLLILEDRQLLEEVEKSVVHTLPESGRFSGTESVGDFKFAISAANRVANWCAII